MDKEKIEFIETIQAITKVKRQMDSKHIPYAQIDEYYKKRLFEEVVDAMFLIHELQEIIGYDRCYDVAIRKRYANIFRLIEKEKIEHGIRNKAFKYTANIIKDNILHFEEDLEIDENAFEQLYKDYSENPSLLISIYANKKVNQFKFVDRTSHITYVLEEVKEA